MNKQDITTYEEAVSYLLDIPRFTTKNSIEDTKRFLHKLGDPDQDMRIIHVAGTNGKGSVCSYMRYVLEEAGYTTAVFTSPHLVDMRERFLVKGEMVTKEAFFEAFSDVLRAVEEMGRTEGAGYHPTFFEYLFFMAMLLFADAKVDFCILETGLGGRLDATNAVSRKELSVITRIGLDHVAYLGDTLEKIAFEKAGIMKAGTPVVYADNDETVSVVFCKRAEELGINAYPVSKRDYAFSNFKNKNIDFSLRTRYYDCISLTLHTLARYQMENAALAVRAIEILDGARSITKEQIQAGIQNCFWQGRMEEVLPDVFVDGAHNEDGIRAFVETVEADGFTGKRTILFGAVSDKDYERMLERLIQSQLFERFALVSLQSARRADVSGLREIVAKNHAEAAVYENVTEAMQDLVYAKGAGERIYIAGSLYLVGEIKNVLRGTLGDL